MVREYHLLTFDDDADQLTLVILPPRSECGPSVVPCPVQAKTDSILRVLEMRIRGKSRSSYDLAVRSSRAVPVRFMCSTISTRWCGAVPELS